MIRKFSFSFDSKEFRFVEFPRRKRRIEFKRSHCFVASRKTNAQNERKISTFLLCSVSRSQTKTKLNKSTQIESRFSRRTFNSSKFNFESLLLEGKLCSSSIMIEAREISLNRNRSNNCSRRNLINRQSFDIVRLSCSSILIT